MRLGVSVKPVFIWVVLATLVGACQNATTAKITPKQLPFFGEFDITGTDTIYQPIPKFALLNQDSIYVSDEDFKGKVVVADFFFTSCPSICPVISAQMVRLQDLLSKENLQNEVKMLSHTVDPIHDKPNVLKKHGEKLGVNFNMWTFATGDPEYIYWQAQQGYQLSAFPSDTAQGGFFHTDKVVLLDQEMRIRGYYDGTSTKSMDQLFLDLHTLIQKK
jgi:protein SCO1/2